MTYQVLHTLGNVIHTGTKAECDLIFKAFSVYGESEHKFDIVKIEEKHKMNDNTREEVCEYLIERLQECMFGDGAESDYIADGMDFKGVYNMTDSELLEQLQYINEDGELYIIASAEMEIERMLSEET